MIRRRSLVALAGVGLALGVSACGTTREEVADAQRRVQEQAVSLVEPRDIERHPAGSPERAVLSWWRALQFRDATSTARWMTEDARNRVGARLPGIVYSDLGPTLQFARPEIVGTAVEGPITVVFLKVRRKSVVSPKIVRESVDHLSIGTRREDGAFRVDDPTFLLEEGDRIREGREAAQAP